MNEISVKTLYPDGSTSPYRALALPAFASLCLMVGALLVLFRTWDELTVPRWALVLAAAAGYVSASAAHRLSRRHGAFYLLGLVPWIPALLMPAACVRGLTAWVSGLTARWNVLHDGSAQLLNTAPDIVDEKAAAFPRLLIRKHEKVSKINVFKGREHGTKSKNLILTGTKGADFHISALFLSPRHR